MANPNHAAASKIAQLLGEVIVHHAPWSSEIGEKTRRRLTDEWLDRLEDHSTTIIGPFIDSVLASTDPTPEIRHIIEQMKRPTAALGSLAQQFLIYGIGFAIGSAVTAPFVEDLRNNLNAVAVNSNGLSAPLSPADIATALTQAVNWADPQGVEVPQWALDEAARSFIGPDQLKTMVGIAGVAPDPTSLFEMYRRGVIDEQQLRDGFLEGPTKNKWIPYLEKLQYAPPTPIDMVRSAVQNQITYDEADKLALSLGLEPPGWINNNPDWFRLLYDTYGRPPGPVEMAHAANRGLTDWDSVGKDSVSFRQAVSESDIKDKYIPLLEKLAVYYPPNGEIRTMVMHGGITDDQAIALWKANGVNEEIANAYLHLAKVEQITQDRALAKGDILTLVKEQAITDDQAVELLADVGYSGQNAATLIKMAHYQYELEVLRRSVTRIGTLYTQHKIDDAAARAAFESVELAPEAIDRLMQSLSAERAAQVYVPTGPQVAAGFHYAVIDQPTAMAMLESLGYEPWQAWFELSTRQHGPLPDEPTKGKPVVPSQPGS